MSKLPRFFVLCHAMPKSAIFEMPSFWEGWLQERVNLSYVCGTLFDAVQSISTDCDSCCAILSRNVFRLEDSPCNCRVLLKSIILACICASREKQSPSEKSNPPQTKGLDLCVRIASNLEPDMMSMRAGTNLVQLLSPIGDVYRLIPGAVSKNHSPAVGNATYF